MVNVGTNYRRKFSSQTSDNMDSRKARRKKLQVCESPKKEDTMARNVRKVGNRCVFSMIRGSGGLKSRIAKAAGGGSCLAEK